MTEEQRDIILYGSRYEIMNRYIDLSNDDGTITEGIAKAMQHYAELYHSRQLKKLEQPIVGNSSLLDDEELKRLIWEEWEGEIKEEDPREMVFKYMKLMRSQFIK